MVTKDDFFYVGKDGSTSQLEKYSITTRSLQLRYVGHRSTVLSLFLREKMLFSGSYDTKIICWNEVDGQLIRTYNGHTGPVNALYVFDSSLYSAGQERIVLRWHIENGNIETVFPEHHDQTIWCFAFEPDSLYSGSIDTTVIRWDLNSSSRQFTYFGRNIKLRSLVLWKYFVVTGGDNLVIRIQDKSTTSVSPIEIISGHSTGIGCMIVQNDTLFSGSGDSTIRRRSLINFEQVKVYFGILRARKVSCPRSSKFCRRIVFRRKISLFRFL